MTSSVLASSFSLETVCVYRWLIGHDILRMKTKSFDGSFLPLRKPFSEALQKASPRISWVRGGSQSDSWWDTLEQWASLQAMYKGVLSGGRKRGLDTQEETSGVHNGDQQGASWPGSWKLLWPHFFCRSPLYTQSSRSTDMSFSFLDMLSAPLYI